MGNGSPPPPPLPPPPVFTGVGGVFFPASLPHPPPPPSNIDRRGGGGGGGGAIAHWAWDSSLGSYSQPGLIPHLLLDVKITDAKAKNRCESKVYSLLMIYSTVTFTTSPLVCHLY